MVCSLRQTKAASGLGPDGHKASASTTDGDSPSVCGMDIDGTRQRWRPQTHPLMPSGTAKTMGQAHLVFDAPMLAVLAGSMVKSYEVDTVDTVAARCSD